MAAMLFGSVLSAFVIMNFVLSAGIVDGDSMWPTLHDGERYLINRWVYHFHKPRRGDIVEIKIPGTADSSVKRIIALSGDVIQIKQGLVYLNGAVLMEPYLRGFVFTDGKAWGDRTFTIPAGMVVVLGDNRPISLDSRRFGAIAETHLIGRVGLRF